MTASLCVNCGRPTPDGYACSHCTARAATQLGAVIDAVPAARDVAHRLTHRGGPGAPGKPGSTLPFDLGATARLDAVQNTLTTLARDIAETRGAQIAPNAFGARGVPDPLVEAATWLSGQLEWVRHAVDPQREPYAVRVFDEIDRCARIITGIARGPASQKYLGPCCVITETEYDGALVTEECDGDVYAHTGARHGVCRTCGISHDVAERQAWLDEEVRTRAFKATEIASAFSINVKTIRSWATDRPGRPARLRAHAHDRDGKPLYLVGDVLDLATADAVRKAEQQAKRARSRPGGDQRVA